LYRRIPLEFYAPCFYANLPDPDFNLHPISME
jgi:hypothetical protein